MAGGTTDLSKSGTYPILGARPHQASKLHKTEKVDTGDIVAPLSSNREVESTTVVRHLIAVALRVKILAVPIRHERLPAHRSLDENDVRCSFGRVPVSSPHQSASSTSRVADPLQGIPPLLEVRLTARTSIFGVRNLDDHSSAHLDRSRTTCAGSSNQWMIESSMVISNQSHARTQSLDTREPNAALRTQTRVNLCDRTILACSSALT